MRKQPPPPTPKSASLSTPLACKSVRMCGFPWRPSVPSTSPHRRAPRAVSIARRRTSRIPEGGGGNTSTILEYNLVAEVWAEMWTGVQRPLVRGMLDISGRVQNTDSHHGPCWSKCSWVMTLAHRMHTAWARLALLPLPPLTLLVIVLLRHDSRIWVISEGRDGRVGDHNGLKVKPGGGGEEGDSGRGGAQGEEGRVRRHGWQDRHVADNGNGRQEGAGV